MKMCFLISVEVVYILFIFSAFLNKKRIGGIIKKHPMWFIAMNSSSVAILLIIFDHYLNKGISFALSVGITVLIAWLVSKKL